MEFKAYGRNIIVKPENKKKVIGDTAMYHLFGKVLSVGNSVKNIEAGDIIGFTMWGVNELVEADGKKTFFVQDHEDFILGIIKKNDIETPLLAK
jgi:hypothetical protein